MAYSRRVGVGLGWIAFFGVFGATATFAQLSGQRAQPRAQPFITGAVVLQDGTPAPGGISIERVCGQSVRRETMTDSHGQYSFQVGNASVGVLDATNSGRPGQISNSGNGTLLPSGIGKEPEPDNPFGSSVNLLNCSLRANAPGFRSNSVDLGMYAKTDRFTVGLIVIAPMSSVPGSLTSASALSAPKEAQKAFKQGLEELKKGKSAEAELKFQQATQQYPQYAEAWFQLGVLAERQNQRDAAKAHYEKAVASDPKYIRPYLQLAALAAASQQWDETIKLTDKLIALDPIDYPTPFYLNAVAHLNLSQLEEAEKSIRQAVAMDRQHLIPRSHLVLGNVLLLKKDYAGAAHSLQTYLSMIPADDPEAAGIRKTMQDAEQAAAQHP